LTGAWELRKLSCKLSLLNSHSTLVLVWLGHESCENSHANSRFSTLIKSHATLALVWLGHESCENSHANSRFSTLMQLLLSFDWGMRVVKTLMQTLASQLLCNFCSRLTGAWELWKLSCKLSLLNSHATLVLVWLGHEIWENSHANSRFSTLINSHATLVLVWPWHESWENSHANSRFSTLIIVWPMLYCTFTFSTQVLLHLVCDLCHRHFHSRCHLTRRDDTPMIDSHYPGEKMWNTVNPRGIFIYLIERGAWWLYRYWRHGRLRIYSVSFSCTCVDKYLK
jgi:hypothetical protein